MLENILAPPVALVGWTIVILLTVPITRFRAAARKQVSAGDFRYGESERVPERVSLPNRNFMNLTEAPVLFYVVCVIMHLSGVGGELAVGLAWGYVAARIVHSLVHLTFNNVRLRLVVFAVSSLILIVMWVVLARHMLTGLSA